MRCLFAASLGLLVGFALVACGPAPKREWPVWTNGDTYSNLNYEPGSR